MRGRYKEDVQQILERKIVRSLVSTPLDWQRKKIKHFFGSEVSKRDWLVLFPFVSLARSFNISTG